MRLYVSSLLMAVSLLESACSAPVADLPEATDAIEPRMNRGGWQPGPPVQPPRPFQPGPPVQPIHHFHPGPPLQQIAPWPYQPYVVPQPHPEYGYVPVIPRYTSHAPTILYGNDDCKIKIGQQIGKGGIGTVYAGTRITKVLKREVRVAIKQVKGTDDVIRGAALQKMVKHSNIVEVMDYFIKRNDQYIVLELIDGSDLGKQVEDGRYTRGSINDQTQLIKQDFTQMAKAVIYMHSKEVYHLDMKPTNFLFDNSARKSQIKLNDFDTATTARWEKGFCGTRPYSAPEVLTGRTYSTELDDVWAMGITLFEMVTKRRPWEDAKDEKAEYVYLSRDPGRALKTLRPQISTDLADLLGRVFVPQKNRIIMEDFLEGFKNINRFTSSRRGKRDDSAPEPTTAQSPAPAAEGAACLADPLRVFDPNSAANLARVGVLIPTKDYGYPVGSSTAKASSSTGEESSSAENAAAKEPETVPERGSSEGKHVEEKGGRPEAESRKGGA